MASNIVCLGHQLREQNIKTATKISKQNALTLDHTKSVLVTKGPTGAVTTSLMDLMEEFRKTPEWLNMEKGGMLSLPVVRFRLMENIRPDKNMSFQFKEHYDKKVAKGKKDIDGYRQDETDQRIRDMIKRNFEEVKQTKGERAAKDETKKSTLFQVEQRWQDIRAEDMVVDAIENAIKDLKVPCLIVKSSKLGHIVALRDMGLVNIPSGAENAETDILLAYAALDILKVAVLEVKRPDCPPWNTTALPVKQNINKAEIQIKKDLEIYGAILEDIPGYKIVFSGHSCFPTCSSTDLGTILCAPCLGGIITKDDLDDMDSLRRKLGIPDTVLASAQSKELLLALSSRVAGQASRLHLHYRSAKDKGRLEKKKHDANTEAVDREIEQRRYVVLDEGQQALVSQFSQGNGSLIMRGRAGSGKTLISTAVAKAMAAQHMNPLTIITTGYGLSDTDALMQHLQQQFQPEAAAGNLLVNTMDNLLSTYSLDPASYLTSDGDKNMPAMISALGVAVAASHHGRKVILLIDECLAQYANLTTDGKRDWSCLSVLPGSVQLCLAFNPTTDHPVLLPSEQRYLSVVGEIRYRSSKRINTLVNFMADRIGWDKCVEEEDQTATDVMGELPVILHCPLATTEQIQEAMDRVKMRMAEQGDTGSVTLLVESYSLTPDTVQAVRATGLAWGWSVCEAADFCGWEDDQVVGLGSGDMEYFSRARLALYVILTCQVQGVAKALYDGHRDAFIAAQQEGLVQYQDM